MTKTIAEIRQDNMRACLNCAIDLWARLARGSSELVEGIDVIEVSMTEMRTIVESHFPGLAVTEEHMMEICRRIAQCTTNYGGLSSCGCFNFAHMIDHVFDLDNLVPEEGEPQH